MYINILHNLYKIVNVLCKVIQENRLKLKFVKNNFKKKLIIKRTTKYFSFHT